MTKLTDNQKTVLYAAARVSFNYSTAADEKGDNATIFGAAEIADHSATMTKITHWEVKQLTANQVKGVMAGLTKRGFFAETEEANTNKKLSCFTDEGIDVAYELEALFDGDQPDMPETPADVPANEVKVTQTDEGPVTTVANADKWTKAKVVKGGCWTRGEFRVSWTKMNDPWAVYHNNEKVFESDYLRDAKTWVDERV